jgi:hypothetical protein
MSVLKAKLPVLYASRQYRPGDTLPVTNARLVDAWLESGAAQWADDEDKPRKAPKAKPATAEAGLPGKSSDGDPEALVGKVPKRGRRK